MADVKTFTRFGCFAAAAVTSVTFQNTTGVFGAVHQTADSVRRQVEAVLDDYDVAAVKTGMLPTREIIETVAEIITARALKNVVVDPVVRSTSGYDLIDDQALAVLTEQLFPLASVVTPNIPEAERISGITIETSDDVARAAAVIRDKGAARVLIKGGHFADPASRSAVDRLFFEDEVAEFVDEYIDTTATHGTGCTLAAAIAAGLASGKELIAAVSAAKQFVTEAIRTAPDLGKGNSPINI